jgi:hypothetical protein
MGIAIKVRNATVTRDELKNQSYRHFLNYYEVDVVKASDVFDPSRGLRGDAQ